MGKISRRKFLTTGGKGVVLVSIPIIFNANPLAALITPSGEKAALTDYYSQTVLEAVSGKYTILMYNKNHNTGTHGNSSGQRERQSWQTEPPRRPLGQ